MYIRKAKSFAAAIIRTQADKTPGSKENLCTAQFRGLETTKIVDGAEENR